MSDVLLKVSGVSVSIPTGQGNVHAVDDAAFSINKHEVFSLIGESGSGKSILGQAIMRLLPPNAVFSGKVELDGTEISALSEKEMQKIRGKNGCINCPEPISCDESGNKGWHSGCRADEGTSWIE